ncbi:MAG: fumarate hydratase [Peptococcaceae bacterium]|nr:fumarate hydratase [Peptococcaceae bacterium]
MRTVDASVISETVAGLCIEAATVLEEDIEEALHKARDHEESPVGKEILTQLLQNAEIAKRNKIPMCQDTGIVVALVEIGQEVVITGGNLYEAIAQGVRKGYQKGYLRKSVVNNPIERKNTNDNTPPVVHYKIVPGDALRITILPKGAGSENMSALKMLKPADGIDGVIKFVLDTVKAAGPNACPPLTVGVGIGGTMEKAALMAKEALTRPLGQRHPLPFIAELEQVLEEKLNALGIGPMGLGGRITVLAVHIEVFATHIASLPVAVNLNCHACRHKTAVL